MLFFSLDIKADDLIINSLNQHEILKRERDTSKNEMNLIVLHNFRIFHNIKYQHHSNVQHRQYLYT